MLLDGRNKGVHPPAKGLNSHKGFQGLTLAETMDATISGTMRRSINEWKNFNYEWTTLYYEYIYLLEPGALRRTRNHWARGDGCLAGSMPAWLARLLWLLPNDRRTKAPRCTHPPPFTDGLVASVAHRSQSLPAATSSRAISVSRSGGGWVADGTVAYVWSSGRSAGLAQRLLRFNRRPSSCAHFKCLSPSNRRGA